MPISIFLCFFCFRVTSPYGTDGQKDGWTAKRRMQPTERPRHKLLDENSENRSLFDEVMKS